MNVVDPAGSVGVSTAMIERLAVDMPHDYNAPNAPPIVRPVEPNEIARASPSDSATLFKEPALIIGV